jgi:RHS repeat-associated protein
VDREAQGAFAYDLRFPGQFFDQATKLHYNYFRDYDPRLGRYIESDPIGLDGGINTYAYGSNDPLRHIDPLGTQGAASGGVEGEFGVGTDYSGYCSSRQDRKKECTEQWESDTKWCDENFRGATNVACKQWAADELERCLKGTPRQPFRR